MIRTISCLAAALFACALPAAAQTDVSGEWAVTFSAPTGPVEITMYVAQQGPKLTGRLTSEAGEFPLRGTIEGDEVTITWSFPDAGRTIEITFEARAEGERMRGVAKLAGSGQGPMSAERTGQ